MVPISNRSNGVPPTSIEGSYTTALTAPSVTLCP